MFSSLCQSATKGILRNKSLLNERLPGLLPRVECIAAHGMDRDGKGFIDVFFGVSHVLRWFPI
jgi:hypothetical protein